MTKNFPISSIKYILTKDTTMSRQLRICRTFVAATRPSEKAKIDKETCEKIIEAAETVKDGTHTVVKEVKDTSNFVKQKISNVAENLGFEVTKKVIEKAGEKADFKDGNDAWDTAKVAGEAFKDKVLDNK